MLQFRNTTMGLLRCDYGSSFRSPHGGYTWECSSQDEICGILQCIHRSVQLYCAAMVRNLLTMRSVLVWPVALLENWVRFDWEVRGLSPDSHILCGSEHYGLDSITTRGGAKRPSIQFVNTFKRESFYCIRSLYQNHCISVIAFSLST